MKRINFTGRWSAEAKAAFGRIRSRLSTDWDVHLLSTGFILFGRTSTTFFSGGSANIVTVVKRIETLETEASRNGIA